MRRIFLSLPLSAAPETASIAVQRKQVGTLVGVGGLVALSLGLRVFALDWGIPTYDASVLANSEYRHSYHIDEDNFLWGLIQMRPSEGNFDVKIYHWGTLQFYLIYLTLLTGEGLGIIPAPWEAAFLAGDVGALPRIYVVGRFVSVAFGVAATLVVARLGALLGGPAAGYGAGAAYAVAPLAVVEAHYLTNDITMSALAAGSVLCAVSAVQNRETRWLALSGLLLGLATSAKYSAAFAFPALMLAQWLTWRSGWASERVRPFLPIILLPWLAAAVGFLLGEPYALLQPDSVLGGLRAASQGNAFDPSQGFGPPLEMLRWQAANLSGLGLTWGIALLALAGLLILALSTFSSSPYSRVATCLRGFVFVPRSAETQASAAIVLAAIVGLAVGLMLNRIPMLRYSQPLVPLLCAAAGVGWAAIPRPPLRWAAGGVAVLLAGVITLGQLSLMSGPHPADALFASLHANVRPGQQIARLWPEYPVLDGTRYRLVRLDPWRPAMPPDADPDYIVLDDMQLGPAAPEFTELVAREYREVVRVGARPGILGFYWDEGETPHDWKYSHPTFVVYVRK